MDPTSPAQVTSQRSAALSRSPVAHRAPAGSARPPLLRYGAAVGATLAALGVTILSRDLLPASPLLFFFGAVSVSAWYGGFGPGFVSSLLAAVLAHLLLLSPDGSVASVQVVDALHLGMFLAVSGLISYLTASLHTAQQEARAQERDAADFATRLDEARRAAERERERMALLAEAGRVLSVALDEETPLGEVARLVVPAMADYCVMYRVEATTGHLYPVVAHGAGRREADLRKLVRRYTPERAREAGLIGQVLRTGRPVLLPTVRDPSTEILSRPNATPPRLLRKLNPGSAIITPMGARDRTLGVLILVSVKPDRRYTEDDLVFATELALRCAVALDNVRLYEASRAANRTKSEFLAVVSHELRTPLTAIMGYQELLAGEVLGSLNETQKGYLRRIHHSAHRLLNLIDQILSLSPVREGENQVKLETVDVVSLVQETAELVKPHARKKGLSLHFDGPGHGLRTSTDPGRLREIVLHLLSNAVKFTEHGDIRLSVEEEDRDGTFLLRVRDTGVGIAARDVARVFEPFTQVDQSSTREAGGVGIGLSLTRQLARALGGEVTLDSAPGHGSTVTVRLPLRAPSASTQ